MLLLAEFERERFLHARKRTFRLADFVSAAGRRDDAGAVARVRAEIDDRAGKSPDGVAGSCGATRARQARRRSPTRSANRREPGARTRASLPSAVPRQPVTSRTVPPAGAALSSVRVRPRRRDQRGRSGGEQVRPGGLPADRRSHRRCRRRHERPRHAGCRRGRWRSHEPRRCAEAPDASAGEMPPAGTASQRQGGDIGGAEMVAQPIEAHVRNHGHEDHDFGNQDEALRSAR